MTTALATQEWRTLTIEEQTAQFLSVGSDLRVYRRTQGAIEADVPVEPTSKELRGTCHQVRKERVPPLEQIRALFDGFMGEYSREVLVWIGQDKKDPTKWHYVVPEQEGTGASVDYDDPDGATATALAAKAKWVGSIHTHPGFSAHPSGTDIENWRKAESAGFHFIVARDHSYSLSAVVGGVTFVIEQGKLPDADCTVAYETAGGKPLDEVLREPRIAKWVGPQYTGAWDYGMEGGPYSRYRERYDYGFHDAWDDEFNGTSAERKHKKRKRRWQETESGLAVPDERSVFYGEKLEDLIDYLRDEGAVELQGPDTFDVIMVGGRTFLLPGDAEAPEVCQGIFPNQPLDFVYPVWVNPDEGDIYVYDSDDTSDGTK